ncbi:MAG: hypothetical protein KIS66_05935 [Fimbriimonadaceae bacterium]|nr:hypothetical protein [Fimbriimonadaceae bacterium]
MAIARKTKRTYALSGSLVQEFESAVPSGDRSRVLEELIARKLEEDRLAKLRADIVAMCEDMAEIWTEESEAWNPIEDEVWTRAS